MIDINNIKLNTSVLELGLSAKLLNRLKISQINTFQQLMEADTSKWENVVAAKVISAMRAAQDKFKGQYEKLIQKQKPAETKQAACPAPEVSSDPQLDGEAYSRMTNTSFAVPSTYDQRRFFVANNILNAYVLSGRLQDEEGPLPVVMREIVKVADAFMDAFDGKPYVEEEDEEEEEETIIPIPTPVTPPAPQKPAPGQKPAQQKQEQSSNSQKQNNNQKKEKNQKQSQKQDSQKQEQQKQEPKKQEPQQKPEPQKEEIQPQEILNQVSYEEAYEEAYQDYVEEPFVEENIPIEIIDVVEDQEGIYQPVNEEGPEVVDVPHYEYESQEQTPIEGVEPEEVEEVVEEVKPAQPQETAKNFDAQHPIAERGQHIRILKYLGRGKRGSKYFQEGDELIIKRMKNDKGLIVVSATINDKNVCFDSKHYTWTIE